jgi:hypothetical protein
MEQDIWHDDVAFFLASGEWKDIYDAVAKMLLRLGIMRPELMWKYMTYVCPACGYVVNNVLHEHVIRSWMPIAPPCPRHHNIHMTRYNSELLMKGSRRFERFRDLLVEKLMLLEILAKRYAGKPPKAWFFYFPPAVEARFDDDPAVFRYVWWRNAVEVYLYSLEQKHQAFLSELKKAVVDYFDLELYVEIKTRHADAVPPGAVYDEKRGVYRIVERP